MSDEEILAEIDTVFHFDEKPVPNVNPKHCEECEEAFEYIVRLSPDGLIVEDCEAWQFDFCDAKYRKFLLPGYCRACLASTPQDIESLAYFIGNMSVTFSRKQRQTLYRLFEHIQTENYVAGNTFMSDKVSEMLEVFADENTV